MTITPEIWLALWVGCAAGFAAGMLVSAIFSINKGK